MEPTDNIRFAKIMHYLSLNFPEREVGQDLMRSYFNDLSEFSIDDIEKAARAYVKTGNKFPLISYLVNLLSA